jgi:hypothetical protein
MSLLIALLLATASAAKADDNGHTGDGHTHEPRPPELLELTIVEAPQSDGAMIVEAVLSPRIDARAEIEVIEPVGVRFEGKGRRVVHTLRRGEPVSREQLRLSPEARRSGKLRVRIRLLEADGRPWLVATHEMKLAEAAPSAAPRRVPVVRTLPDGSRIVEYMSESEVAGQPAPPRPKKSIGRPPSAGTSAPERDAGGDVPRATRTD